MNTANETAYVTVSIRVANSPYDYRIQNLIKVTGDVTLEIEAINLQSIAVGVCSSASARINKAIYDYLEKLEAEPEPETEEKDGENG